MAELPAASMAHEEPSKAPIATEKDDIGLQYIAQHGIASYTPEEERRVRWKLDLNLMPMVSGAIGWRRMRLGSVWLTKKPKDDVYLRLAVSRQSRHIIRSGI